MPKKISPLKQIRLKCLDCCVGSSFEVKMCTALTCPLWTLRFGKTRSKTLVFSEEQRKRERSIARGET